MTQITLYHSTGTCSGAVLITLRELATPHTLHTYNSKERCFDDGKTIRELNPGNYVPIMVLDNGDTLVEANIAMQYLCDITSNSSLSLPKQGSVERYHFMALMNFIATELHKSFSPFFVIKRVGKDPELLTAATPPLKKNLYHKLSQVDGWLSDNDYLFQNTFSIADIYVFVIMEWSHYLSFDLTEFKNLTTHHKLLQSRPAIRTLIEEKLIDYNIR